MKSVNVGYLFTYELAEKLEKVGELGQMFTTDYFKNTHFIMFLS